MIALPAWLGASAFHLTNPAAIARFLDPLVHKYLRWVASLKTKSMEENNAKRRDKVGIGRPGPAVYIQLVSIRGSMVTPHKPQ